MPHSKRVSLAFTLAILLMQTGCSFVSDQLHDNAMEEQHLKPGALDVPVAANFRTYNYKFLDEYHVTHDWIFSGKCHYGAVDDRATSRTIYTGNIFEAGEHTYVDREAPSYPIDRNYPKGTKNLFLDRYVRPEWQMGPDRDGNFRTVKGFTPICGQVWGGTSHSLSISLVKLPLDAAINRYTERDVPLEKQTVGSNTWITQSAEIKPREINTYAGSYLAWLLPIGDTGYSFVFKLGANHDSLKHPQAHAQMQAIFQHLIESVKIEPINASIK